MSQPPDPNDPNNPFGANPWSQPPNSGNNSGWQQNPYQQNPYQQNPYQQNPYQQNPYQSNPFMFGGQTDLPNATAILVLGIVSIVFAFCYGIIGVGLGIASLVMANKAMRTYEANPSLYAAGSVSNVRAGRICAIIGLSLGSLVLLVIILELVFFASMFSSFGFH